MKYFKAFDKDLKCYNNFQYEVGKTYDTGYKEKLTKADVCTNHVFHFCDSIESLYRLYPLDKTKNRICEVEPLGDIVFTNGECNIFASNKLKIVREIVGDEYDYLTGKLSNELLTKRFHELYGKKNRIFSFLKRLLIRLKIFNYNPEIIRVGKKFNFSDGAGFVISPNLWFDFDYFDYLNNQTFLLVDFINVKLNGKYNYINRNGKLLSDIWFDCCQDCFKKNGIAKVKLNKKYNFINSKGELIFKQWCDYCYSLEGGYARVIQNNKWNIVSGKSGKLISEQWFDYCYDYFEEGYFIVKLNNKYNFIDTDGKILSDIWLDNCYPFCEGHARIVLNDKWNFIDKKGELLSDVGFDECRDFHDGAAYISIGRKEYFIDEWGEIYDYANGLKHIYSLFSPQYFYDITHKKHK